MDFKRVKNLTEVGGANRVIHENILYYDTTKTHLKKALGEERMTRVFKLVDAQRSFVEMKMPVQSKTSTGAVAYAANSSLYRDEYDMDSLEVTTNLEEADILVEVRDGSYRMFSLNEASVVQEPIVESEPEQEAIPEPNPVQEPEPITEHEPVIEPEPDIEPETATENSLYEYLVGTVGRDNFDILEHIRVIKIAKHQYIRNLKHPELQKYTFVIR